jgi:branched-chain amino acid transport system ATP-binding protein
MVKVLMEFLTIKDISKSFGGVHANRKISLSIGKNEIVSIIGPNGAGKTTLFNIITGVHRPDSGSILFAGSEITQIGTPAIARLGLVRTFQQTKIFRDLTVTDAVMVGHHLHDRTTLVGSFLSSPFAKRERKAKLERALEILDFVGMSDRRDTITQNLPYGEQKVLNVAVALSAQPKMLLMDEPAAGMNPIEAIRMMETIRRIRESGITVCLVEHNMRLVMNISERVFVLDYGDLIFQGPPEEVRENPRVVEVYLGRQSHA